MKFIDNIEIKNFKSIRHQKIEGCKRINVFIGPPNVGKSNILEALSLFSIDKESTSFSDFVRMGRSTTLFFNGIIENPIQIIVNKYFRAKLSLDRGGVFASINEDRFSGNFENLDAEIENASFSEKSDTREKLIIRASFFINEENNQIANFEGDSDLRIYNSSIEDKAISKLSMKSAILKYEFKKDIKYNSKNPWRLKYPFGENIFEIISSKKDLIDSVIDIFDGFGLKFLYDTEIQEYKILKIIGNKIFTIPYFLTADTLRRLIFYKAAIASNENAILIFEEPEANCYEPYILEITNAIKNDINNNQFFIVTHSQYVVDELLRDEQSRNDTNIYLVGADKGETKIKRLKPEVSKDVYQTGLNIFFNYQSLWDEN